MKPFYFNIEVLGSGQCNLRCPTCAVGNSRGVRNPMGLMRAPMLEQIMKKATSECAVSGVGLFNWAEPLMHPDLPLLIRVVHEFGVPTSISSNLNYAPDLVALMDANPTGFRISVSAFSQAQYSVTHRGGDIEVVKRNMRSLAEAKAATSATTAISVCFHRYKGNLDDEIAMSALCDELGFAFQPVWAFMTPLEKVLAYLEDDPTLAAVDEDDLAIMDRLVPTVDDAVTLSAPYRSEPCTLLDEQITLDYRGDVMQCCAVYDTAKYRVSSFLAEPLEAIQAKKRAASICSRCMKRGLHVYYTYGAGIELDELATAQRAGLGQQSRSKVS